MEQTYHQPVPLTIGFSIFKIVPKMLLKLYMILLVTQWMEIILFQAELYVFLSINDFMKVHLLFGLLVKFHKDTEQLKIVVIVFKPMTKSSSGQLL